MLDIIFAGRGASMPAFPRRAWEREKGLPLQANEYCRGNPLWLPLVYYYLGVALIE